MPICRTTAVQCQELQEVHGLQVEVDRKGWGDMNARDGRGDGDHRHRPVLRARASRRSAMASTRDPASASATTDPGWSADDDDSSAGERPRSPPGSFRVRGRGRWPARACSGAVSLSRRAGRLLRPLACLVGGQRLGGVDITERRVRRHDLVHPRQGRHRVACPRIAIRLLAFISPIPGSASRRRCEIGPVRSPRSRSGSASLP